MMKKMFSTPKRTAISMCCLFLVLAVIGIGTVFTAKSAMKQASIGEENAKNFAFADAGVDPVQAKRVHSEYSHEQGHFVYEVEFVADNTEYQYWIKAEDGSVVKKQMEVLDIKGSDIATAEKSEEDSQMVSAPGAVGSDGLDMAAGNSGAAAQDMQADTPEAGSQDAAAGSPGSSEDNAGSGRQEAQTGHTDHTDYADTGSYIGVDRAKAIALEHAGYTESEIVFSKAKLENDDGYTVYEVEFYKDRVEYEYQINAATGEIMEYDMDRDH